GHRAFGALTKREAAEARGTEYGMTVAPLGISARKDALMPNKVDRQRRTNVRSRLGKGREDWRVLTRAWLGPVKIMRLLNIESSPRGSKSASTAVTNAFL